MNKIADVLTLTRMILVGVILLVGGLQGVAALPTVALLTVACWVTDTLDGKLARQAGEPTRLGRFDVVADQGLALALAACLVLWEVVSLPLVVIVIIGVVIGDRVFRFDALQKFAMGMAYAALMFTTWKFRPGWLWVLLGGLGLLILLNPERAKKQVIGFLQQVGGIFPRWDDRQGAEERWQAGGK